MSIYFTELHARLFSRAVEKVAGKPEAGAITFVRCLNPDIVGVLATEEAFAPRSWQVYRVADADDASQRTITADRAVELRETKDAALLLLVDTERAGAGMDGIYSAAQEIDEAALFAEALRLAKSEVTDRLSRSAREYAEAAFTRAIARRRLSLSPGHSSIFWSGPRRKVGLPGSFSTCLGYGR